MYKGLFNDLLSLKTAAFFTDTKEKKLLICPVKHMEKGTWENQSLPPFLSLSFFFLLFFCMQAKYGLLSPLLILYIGHSALPPQSQLSLIAFGTEIAFSFFFPFLSPLRSVYPTMSAFSAHPFLDFVLQSDMNQDGGIGPSGFEAMGGDPSSVSHAYGGHLNHHDSHETSFLSQLVREMEDMQRKKEVESEERCNNGGDEQSDPERSIDCKKRNSSVSCKVKENPKIPTQNRGYLSCFWAKIFWKSLEP